jgi:O-antigen/teichoic acid export membrane protein
VIVSSFRKLRFVDGAPRSLGRSGILALVVRLSPGIATFATSILVGRFGGPTLLGVTQTALSTATFTSLFLPTPAGVAASRFIASSKVTAGIDASKAVAGHLARWVALGLLTLAAVTLAVQWHTTDDALITVVTALLVVAVGARTFAEGVHVGLSQVGRLSVWSAAAAIASTSGLVVLLAVGIRSTLILTPLVVASLALAAFSWPPARTARLDRQTRAAVWRFIALGIAGTVASSGVAQLAVLLSAAVGGYEFAGQYAAALALTSPIAMLASSLSLVLFPVLASAHASKGTSEIRNLVDISTRHLAVVLVAVALVMMPLGELIVRPLWGDRFVPAAHVLCLLLPGIVLNSIAVPAVNVLTSRSNRGMVLSAVCSWTGLAVAAVIWAAYARPTALWAIPVGYLVAVSLTAALPFALTWRLLGLRWGVLAFKVCLALSATALLSYALMQYAAPPILTIAASFLAALTWALANWKDTRRTLDALIRSVASRT